MRLDRLTVALRPRNSWESIDLGFSLVRSSWRSVWAAWSVTVLPLGAVVMGVFHAHPQLTWCVLWWLKPLYDRIVLHVLAGTVFGEPTRLPDLWRAIPGLLSRSGLLYALTLGRIGMLRSFDLPISQLEHARGRTRRERLRLLRREQLNAAQGVTFACANCELAISLGAIAFLALLIPEGMMARVFDELAVEQEPIWFSMLLNGLYLLAVSVIEPFYVGGGFALYLNRRAWLEGWDLEIAFRRIAARVGSAQPELAA